MMTVVVNHFLAIWQTRKNLGRNARGSWSD